ncbi:MAG: hypothetical protein WD971_08915 [Pirellulales bacterium]
MRRTARRHFFVFRCAQFLHQQSCQASGAFRGDGISRCAASRGTHPKRGDSPGKQGGKAGKAARRFADKVGLTGSAALDNFCLLICQEPFAMN